MLEMYPVDEHDVYIVCDIYMLVFSFARYNER